MIESLLITCGFLKRYKSLDLGKVQHLAIVIDSEEARQTSDVLCLLRWLAAIGFKNVCLYDKEGVLKRSEQTIKERLKREKICKGFTTSDLLPSQHGMELDFISFSDGKEAVARAANFLFQKHYLSHNKEKQNVTESDMADALEAIGYRRPDPDRPDPDLILIYGPTRCHQGFPAWRITYSEIVHMGPLKSMKFGILIKAIHRFTMVHQNFGT